MKSQKNIKPISNLSDISKLVELVINSQFKIYMVEKDLNEPMQSAYWTYQGDIAAQDCISIYNDIMEAVDGGFCVIHVLLDLGAKFDTLDHDILLHRLRIRL